MSIFDRITNSIQYSVHKATYDPEAEKYVQAQTEKADKAAVAAAAAKTATATDKEKAAAAAAEKARIEQEEQVKKDRAEFDVGRMFGKVFGTVFTILLVFLLIVGGVFGASLAVNLNLYKDVLYRILYAIYGFVFFWIVIPYVLGYRWYWKGHKPRFYSLIPLIPFRFDNKWAAMLFSWMSFKPDDQIESLKEWKSTVRQ